MLQRAFILTRLCPSSLQPTIDMLLNVTIFMWYGAVCPWEKFLHNGVIPIYRLIPLGILILLFRRLPAILGMRRWIHQIDDLRQAIFMGFFGPVGVSGVFYLYITLEFIETLSHDGEHREDVANLGEATLVIVWFIAVCSVVSSIQTSPRSFFTDFPKGRSWSQHPPGETGVLSPSNNLPDVDVPRRRRQSRGLLSYSWPCEQPPASNSHQDDVQEQHRDRHTGRVQVHLRPPDVQDRWHNH